MSLPKGAVKIYDQLIEIRAKKGSKEESLFPNEYFKHSFKGKTKAAVYGLKNGALYICSQAGKPLHKKFEYSGRDYKSNPKKQKMKMKKYYYILNDNEKGLWGIRSRVSMSIPNNWNQYTIFGPYNKKPTISEIQMLIGQGY